MKNLKNVLWFVKKNKKTYTIGVSFLILAYVFIPIPNWVIGKIIDEVKLNSLRSNSLTYYGVILLVSIVLLYIVEYVWHYYIFGNSFKSARDTRRRLVSKILRQGPAFFKENSTGSLMSKATYDVGSIQTLTGYGVLAFFDASLYPLSIIFIMGFSISWRLTFFSILCLPSIIVISKILGNKLTKKYNKIQRSMEKLNESVLENITSIRVIKGFSTQEISRERFDKKAEDLYRDSIDQAKTSALFIPTGRLIPSIGFVIALLIGENLMGKGSLSLGQLVSFIMYLGQLQWPMFAFGDLINVIQEASSALGRIQKIYDYQEDIIEKDDTIIYKASGDIEFKNFSFTYPGEKQKTLDNINLRIKKGQTLGIVGKIGSGKTTLVKQLLRFYKLEDKTMFMDDRPVEDYSIRSIRDKIGYVSQEHILFSKSIYDNVAFGKSEASHDEVIAAMDFAQFLKDFSSLPNGLDTMIGEKGISISGGQKQRISIARAIIKDPEILILDDSLSAVDALTEKNIVDNIKDKRKNKTTIIVAHRLSGLKHADKIIVLEDGRIVEEGNHEELISNKGWYYNQYEMQRLGVGHE